MNLGKKENIDLQINYFVIYSDTLRDILSLLRNTNHPQGKIKVIKNFYYSFFLGDQMIKIMRSWARTNNIPV